MAKLSISKINKNFSQVKALQEISFESKENEFVTILGPSGCGKTTLLRIIAGLEVPNSGKISIDDVDITKEEPKDRNIAMVFQTYALYPQKSVYNNLAFPLKLAKVDRNEMSKKVKNIAKLLEIEDLLSRKPDTLSGGQKQRVAIGKAMIRNPKAFLFDEPLSNLDAALREKMKQEIKKLHAQVDSLFLYVTHDQNEAMSLGDRIIVMKDGEIQQIGTPYEIYNNPANQFVATFVGNPKMNIVDGNTYKILSVKEEPVNLENIVFGIRPEHIILDEYKNGDKFGTIVSIEDRGKEIIYKVNFENESILVCCLRMGLTKEYSIGDKVVCNLLDNHVYLFNKETGKLVS